METLVGTIVAKEVKKLYDKVNSLERLALKECQRGNMNVINFMHTLKMAVHTDVVLIYKVELYENIMGNSTELLDNKSVDYDFETLSISIEIIKSLSLKELWALKLVYNKFAEIKDEQITKAINQVVTDGGMHIEDVQKVLQLLYTELNIDNVDSFIQLTNLLCLKGYCVYRDQVFGMLNSNETIIRSKIPTINTVYQREMHLFFKATD